MFLDSGVIITIIVMLFVVLVSIQYTLNKILVELKEIKKSNLMRINKEFGLKKTTNNSSEKGGLR